MRLARRLLHAPRGLPPRSAPLHHAQSRSLRPLTVLGIESSCVQTSDSPRDSVVAARSSRTSFSASPAPPHSCDDTGVAVVRVDERNSRQTLAEFVSSQFDVHSRFGGVVPHLAARAHDQNLPLGLAHVQSLSGLSRGLRDVDAVAVTAGPGLSLCLKVGYAAATFLAHAMDRPLVRVNHLEGHALVPRFLDPSITFPFLLLLVSGGHTLLVLVRGVGQYERLGSTLDDSVGECFDKVARLLRVGRHVALQPSSSSSSSSSSPATAAPSNPSISSQSLPSPSSLTARLDGYALGAPVADEEDVVHGHYGAALELLAREGDPTAFRLPVPLRARRGRPKHSRNDGADGVAGAEALGCDFSFAGLKSAVARLVEENDDRDARAPTLPTPSSAPASPTATPSATPSATSSARTTWDPRDRAVAADLAASFQRTACTHIVHQLRIALDRCEAGAREGRHDPVAHLVVSGGVAANTALRSALTTLATERGVRLACPPPRLCTDNGTMIAWAAAERLRAGCAEAGLSPGSDFSPRWPLGTPLPVARRNGVPVWDPAYDPDVRAWMEPVWRTWTP